MTVFGKYATSKKLETKMILIHYVLFAVCKCFCIEDSINPFRHPFRLEDACFTQARIFAVVQRNTEAVQKGELHLNELKKLLPKTRYPTIKHHFLLELMRKFSLCFTFPDEPDRYLVPSY
jgi:hypothetical protein